MASPMPEDEVEYDCRCEDCGGDFEGPSENVCPNCLSDNVDWANV